MAKEIKTYTAEVFLKEKHTLGESPFYDVRTKTLSWVDITEGKLTNWTLFSSQAQPPARPANLTVVFLPAR